MKFSNLKKNKLAQSINYEYPIIVFSIIVISVVLFFLNSMIFNIDKNYNENVPNLNSEFPLIFVNTFLNSKLNDEDLKLYEDFKNIKTIGDLFSLENSIAINKLSIYREEYINKLISASFSNDLNLFDLYSLSENKEINKDNLLQFEFNILPDEFDILNSLKSGEVIFPIKNKDGSYDLVYFQNG